MIRMSKYDFEFNDEFNDEYDDEHNEECVSDEELDVYESSELDDSATEFAQSIDDVTTEDEGDALRTRKEVRRAQTWQNLLSKVKYGAAIAAISASLGTLAVTGYVVHTLSSAPTVDVTTFKVTSNSNMYDKDGNLIWSDTQRRRDFVSIKDVPDDYKNLLLSTEDADFYTHKGYSPKAIANAAISVVKEKLLKKGSSRGGSTIEQQLIKNHVFSQSAKDRTIDRKLKEIWLSSQLDLNYSKDQILEWYVNSIELGERSVGIDTISMTYFGKHISELNSGSDEDLSKLAIIAGLGQAPSIYNLYDNPKAVSERRYEVLLSALNKGKITQEQFDRINEIDIQNGLQERFWRDSEVLQTMTTYSAHITSALQQVKDLGYDLEKTPLQIYTTLDRDATDKLQNILDTAPGLRTDEQQMAATVIDNESGHVIAQVGGRHQSEPMSLNRATQRNRSTGSSIKPILDYAPAIEYLGYGTSFGLSGAPYTYPGTNFTAYNYGGAVYGTMDLQTSLRMSLNTPAIRLLDEHVGAARAKAFMSRMSDLDVNDSYGGTDALGLNVSTADLATGFAAFSRLGQYQKAQYVTKLVFSDGSEKEIKFEHNQAMLPSTAYIILKILEGVPPFSAQGAEMPELSVAMKTGTVGYSGAGWPDHAASDVWIAATTKSITTAIWSGYDVPQENLVWDNASTRHSVVKSVVRTFSAGKDNSEWANPGNVNVSGSGIKAHYSPTTVYREPDYSLAKLPIESSGSRTLVKSILDDKELTIKPEKEIDEKELQEELKKASDWHTEFSGDDRKLYEAIASDKDVETTQSIPADTYDNKRRN